MKGILALILSGAFGVVLPEEAIHSYEKPMNSRYWVRNKLPEVIEEYIENNAITHVYGFFSRTSDYTKIMKRVNWETLKEQSDLSRARTYYIDYRGGGGYRIVPSLTGMLIASFIESDFDDRNFYRNPFHGYRVKVLDHCG